MAEPLSREEQDEPPDLDAALRSQARRAEEWRERWASATAERDALARRVEALRVEMSTALRDFQRGDDEKAHDRLRRVLAADDEAAK